jgi:nucleotide-binding universal stress UspA family protein
MKTINKIMVAVDFSEYSMASVAYAKRLAEEVYADLLLVNVINQRDVNLIKRVAARVPEFSIEAHLEEWHQDRETRFIDLIKTSGCQKLPVETLILIGVPYQQLLNAIEEKKPNLLIMATKGRSNLVDTLVGSCALKMFRRSPIPVLSIRDSG